MHPIHLGIPVILSFSLNAFALSISTPADSSAFFERDTISFICTSPVGDQFGAGLRWKSDHDGELGRGDSLSTSALSVGSHLITISNDSSVVADSVRVTILQFDAIDVYCAGGNNARGYYWINGERHSVSPDPEIYIKKICANKNSYYFIKQPPGSMDSTSGYWKNGSFIQVPGRYKTQIMDLYVNDTVVCLCGWNQETVDGPVKACYWKNDTIHYLSDSISGVYAIDFDSSLYLAGINNFRRCYWKDGKITYLDPPNSLAYEIAHIQVSNGDVYIAAIGGIREEDMIMYASYYWHNAKWTWFHHYPDVTNPRNGYFIRDFRVYGKDVLAIGRAAAGPELYYWKNGVSKEWDDPDSPGRDGCRSLDVLHGHVFVAGSFNGRPCYWRNGVRYMFADTSTTGQVGGIFSIDVVVRTGPPPKPTPAFINPGSRHTPVSGKRLSPPPAPLRAPVSSTVGLRSRRGVWFDILGRLKRLMQ